MIEKLEKGKCSHSNLTYNKKTLTCSDCNQSGLEQYLEERDFPATFEEIYQHANTGFNVSRINNHVDKITFYRSFDRNVELLIQTRDLQEALTASASDGSAE